MAHAEQKTFLTSVQEVLPQFFINADALDIGSMDINGNNRYLFSGERGKYTGLDLGEGPNVDVVCSGHLFDSPTYFDTIVSSEAFEHDRNWVATIKNAIRLLRHGGLLVFTCASEGRHEHGTSDNISEDSPFTNDYYRNLNEIDIRAEIDIDNIFSSFDFQYNAESHDLYFWGIKKKNIG